MSQQQQPQPLAALSQLITEVAALHRDQSERTCRQLELLQAQSERHTAALEALLSRSVAEILPVPASAAPPIVTLLRMTAEDDPPSFLDVFETTAKICRWPETEWAFHLLPLLTGEAQAAALLLPVSARGRYPDLRRAILDRMGFFPEDYRRRFRKDVLGAADRPFAYAQRIKDAAARWLVPSDSKGEARMLEAIVMEQFVAGLPAGAAEWVRCHRPSS